MNGYFPQTYSAEPEGTATPHDTLDELIMMSELENLIRYPNLSEMASKPVRRAYGQEIENFLLPILRRDYEDEMESLNEVWEQALITRPEYITKGSKGFTYVDGKKEEVQMPSLTEIKQQIEAEYTEERNQAKISSMIELLKQGGAPSVRWSSETYPMQGTARAQYLEEPNIALIKSREGVRGSQYGDVSKDVIAELAHAVQAKAEGEGAFKVGPLETVMISLGQLLTQPSRRHQWQKRIDPRQKSSLLEQLVIGPLREKMSEAGSYLAGYTRPGAYEYEAHKVHQPRLGKEYLEILARILSKPKAEPPLPQ